MTAAQADLHTQPLEAPQKIAEGIRIDRPSVVDGAALWRIAGDSGALDLNSSYSYLLWCRDFADTSVVARDDSGEPVGFVTGYVRPERPDTLLVWQVAVDEAHRGLGLAAALLDGLTERVARRHPLTTVETTITPGNTASERLFAGYAARHGADIERTVLFEAGDFPDGPHPPEMLHRIGPLSF
ncbi:MULTISPECIES: diaminobutyrate acetyltransferase [Streptomyces]|uniref:L-2,4-diaminobutyric acid acetyltransferase n=1 Tax=Streptomyces stelliscabiei TaxID=146820 RepID=A0A8I0NYR9_9ACTN|nr:MULTISPECIES: diaminobutyrate acetyltransferase [Streptomyces]MBE1596128.1 L-2,4-diaminobutyric acid acetyltransferase [Streptomyces stelliscabiei]MDX2519732.1 diaminobutyrate acetyltransferase [Streptomyces stelliscabiei]MDX2556653.1 diaminobutyrate acetyltransferase [Streptomyces stelliscabiei]MDX2615656.1 diaminobutyrate acetyltransferase [Streptomyces stelliscabiei]MDX2640399.1 diaminobutyrate acetyltransferase [Streptomyces stelliscabiei]